MTGPQISPQHARELATINRSMHILGSCLQSLGLKICSMWRRWMQYRGLAMLYGFSSRSHYFMILHLHLYIYIYIVVWGHSRSHKKNWLLPPYRARGNQFSESTKDSFEATCLQARHWGGQARALQGFDLDAFAARTMGCWPTVFGWTGMLADASWCWQVNLELEMLEKNECTFKSPCHIAQEQFKK